MQNSWKNGHSVKKKKKKEEIKNETSQLVDWIVDIVNLNLAWEVS